MRRIVNLAAIGIAAICGTGCSTMLRGDDSDRDVHLHLTYLMARKAGFSEAESRAIASGNCHTDYHPETNSVGTERRVIGGLINPLTVPRIIGIGLIDWGWGGETAVRAFAGQTAGATAWALRPLAHRLHFPSPGLYQKTVPAFRTHPETGEMYYNNREAMIVLEQAFRALETRDPDVPRALALLGIGLHTLQDSYKHQGYCGAFGHIGVFPDPDDISRDPGMALEIAEATLNSLRHARRLLHGTGIRIAEGWREEFQRIYTVPLRGGERRQDRWIGLIRETLGDSYGGWDDTRERWLADGGGEAFERALDRVR